MNYKKTILIGLAMLALTVNACAQTGSISSSIWKYSSVVICGLYMAFAFMGGALCALMLVYGGVKWITGADDPGARKAAKDVIMHAIIGVVVLLVVSGIAYFASGGELAGC